MGRDRKDAGGEEVPCLPAFLNIIPYYPELTQAKEIMVKRQPGKNWRMRFSEIDLLGPAPADGRHSGGSTLPSSHPDRDAPNRSLNDPPKACLRDPALEVL